MIGWLTCRRGHAAREDAPTSPRFTVLAGRERFEADSFVGIVRQMRARGLSNDAILTAALEICRRNRGAVAAG